MCEDVLCAGKKIFGRFIKSWLIRGVWFIIRKDTFHEVASSENETIEIFDEKLFQKFLQIWKTVRIKSAEKLTKKCGIWRIGNRAVREAQAENHRLGLPNIYSRNGKIIYEMPDGEIIVKENRNKE